MVHVSRESVCCILVWLACLKRVCGALWCAAHSLVHSLGTLSAPPLQHIMSFLQDKSGYLQDMIAYLCGVYLQDMIDIIPYLQDNMSFVQHVLCATTTCPLYKTSFVRQQHVLCATPLYNTSLVPHLSTGKVKEEVVIALLVIEMFNE